MRDDKPVWPEERLGSRWWVVERDGQTVGPTATFADPARSVRERPIPTAVGLKIREYMYQVEYDSPNWEDKLDAFTRKKLNL